MPETAENFRALATGAQTHTRHMLVATGIKLQLMMLCLRRREGLRLQGQQFHRESLLVLVLASSCRDP